MNATLNGDLQGPRRLPVIAASHEPPGTLLRRWAVVLLAVTGALAFAAAYFQPWWEFLLYAPQYPHGLHLTVSLTGVSGDVREVNMLNHYIGMASLDQAATVERALAAYGIGALAAVVLLLVMLAGRRHGKWLFFAGALLPLGFVADSFYWLRRFGHDLDPRAPLHIPPFTPEMFGNGSIGQFMTFAHPALGFWLAVGGVVLLSAAAWLRASVCRGCRLRARCSRVCPRAFVGPDKKGRPVIDSWRPAALVGLLISALIPSRAQAAAAGVGPRPLTAPQGATVVRDDAGLRRALAHENGPREIWLARGRYRGPLLVQRSVALRGEQGAVIDGGGQGTVLTLTAPDTVLDNLTVQHSGRNHTSEDAAVKATADRVQIQHVRVQDALYGISAGPCRQCRIDDSHVIGDGAGEEFRGDAIKLWEAHDSRVQRCRVEGARDVVVWYSRRVLLDGNVVTGSRYGTHFMYAHDSIVRNSRITDNVVGIFVMYSARMHLEDNVLAGARGAAGMGVGFKDSDGVQVRRNWMVANTVGAYLDRTPVSPRFPVLFADNVIALNQLALRIHGAERGARFTHNDFTQNVSVAEVEGGGDALGLEFSGNHWSDYAGYDLNADGVGDVAFQLKQLSSDMQQQHPALKFFEGTAALRLVDWISHAVPVLTSQLILVDPAPAIRSHRSRS